jgi:hypothetical protein
LAKTGVVWTFPGNELR